MQDQTGETGLATVLLILVGALVVFPMIFMGVGMMGIGPMMGGTSGGGMWDGGGMPGWLFLVGLVMQLLVLAALVGGGYLIYRALTGREDTSDQALEELRLAYARGELSDEEYEHRREALERDAESR
ncbi:MAG: putative membrane protein [Natronomonas sp.]|jgi:putative membrane protein